MKKKAEKAKVAPIAPPDSDKPTPLPKSSKTKSAAKETGTIKTRKKVVQTTTTTKSSEPLHNPTPTTGPKPVPAPRPAPILLQRQDPPLAPVKAPPEQRPEPPVIPPTVPPTRKPTPPPSWWERKTGWTSFMIPIAVILISLVVIFWILVPALKANKPVAPAQTDTTVTTAVANIESLQKTVDEINRRLETQAATPVTITGSTLDPTNAIRSLRGGLYVGDNSTVVLGSVGDNSVVGNDSTVVIGAGGNAKRSRKDGGSATATPAKVWPRDFTPTRTIEATECLLTSGCESFKLTTETIRAGDDVKVVIPNGWNVEWYSTANQGQIEVAKDGSQYRPFDDRTAPAGGDGLQHREWRFRLASGLPEAKLELTFKKL